jgi:hypothetical protein
LRKRLKASCTSAAVQGFDLEGFSLEDLGLAGFLAGCFAARAGFDLLAGLATGLAAGDLDFGRGARMIFAMIRVY